MQAYDFLQIPIFISNFAARKRRMVSALFFWTERKCIIPFRNLDNFSHWDNEQLSAGVLCRIYQSYIPHGRRSGVCYQWWAVESLGAVTIHLFLRFFYAPGFLSGTKETTRNYFLTMDTFFSNTHPRSMASCGNANMQPFASLLIINVLAYDAAFCSLPKIEKAAFCSLSFPAEMFE